VLGILTLSRLILVLIAMLLVTSMPTYVSASNTTLSQSDSQNGYSEGLGAISYNLGELVFSEDFQIGPFGFNESQWNLITINNPSLTWMNENRLDLWGERFKSIVLKSSQLFSPCIIAEINVSFTLGSCYFCIGWCDNWRDEQHDWIANGRECTNGVFIDCWDGDLFLVTYADGERTATLIDTSELLGWHELRIEWTESLVQLDIDEMSVGFVSRTIPQTQLAFTFMVSGHHTNVEPGRLSVDSLRIFEYYRSPSQSDPEIVLLWPANNSIVRACSFIDFEVRGAESNLSCSWEGSYPLDVSAPWDVQVPFVIYGPPLTLPISLHLAVSAIDAEGHQSSSTFMFRVDDPEDYFGVWFMPNEPTVDGFVDTNEKNAASNLEVVFRSECDHEVKANLLAGYTSDSLYIAIESPIPNSYHSRATLFLDGDADLMCGYEPPDISITVASPSADSSYTCISGIGEDLVTDVAYDALEHDGSVTYEYLIPLHAFKINEDGVALRVQLSNGGYNLDFPGKAISVIIFNLGAAASNADTFRLTSVVGCIIVSAAIIGLSVYAARREIYYLDLATSDERLDRIKILLLSFDRIDLSRLSRMAGLEKDVVKTLVEELIKQGFPAYNANGEYLRYRKTVKQNKTVLP
jgi:hypothetical protein